MAPRAPRAGTKLCAVTIGYQDFVLPLDKALKLVALLEGAIECGRDYQTSLSKTVYRRCIEQPTIGMEVLAPGQYNNDPLAEREPGDE